MTCGGTVAPAARREVPADRGATIM